jgi:hypothetical protein
LYIFNPIRFIPILFMLLLWFTYICIMYMYTVHACMYIVCTSIHFILF